MRQSFGSHELYWRLMYSSMYQSRHKESDEQHFGQEIGSFDYGQRTLSKPKSVSVGTFGASQAISARQCTVMKTDSLIYKSFFGFLRYQTDARYLESKFQLATKSLSDSRSITINLTLLRLGMKYNYQHQSKLPKSLSFYPVMQSDSEIFDYCRSGMIEEFKMMLVDKRMSPLVQDEYGNTLFYYTSQSHNPEFGALVLRLGVDPNQTNMLGYTALLPMSLCWYLKLHIPQPNVQNTLRILASAREEISLYETTCLFLLIGPDLINPILPISGGLNVLSWADVHSHVFFLALSCLGCSVENRL